MTALPIIHIGGMRTGSTFLQQIFRNHPQINDRIKIRNLYINEPNYLKFHEEVGKVWVDSDENYSLGRFKHQDISWKDSGFNFKTEFQIISHDIHEMSQRLKKQYCNARVLLIIREQKSWIHSIYKHDVLHFGVDSNFDIYSKSFIGRAYQKAGNYYNLYKIYENLFGANNVKVLLYEDLRSDSQSFVKEISNFFKVDLQGAVPKQKINTSPSHAFLFLLRMANSIGQKKSGKQERRVYYWLRSLLILGEKKIFSKVQNVSNRTQLVNQRSLSSFKEPLIDGNRRLASTIRREADMQEKGYFDL